MTSISSLISANFRKQGWTNESNQAFYLAESGLKKAEYLVQEQDYVPPNQTTQQMDDESNPWFSSATGEFPEGGFKVWSQYVSNDVSTFTDVYTFRSVGVVNKQKKILEEKVAISNQPMFGKAVFETVPTSAYYDPTFRWDPLIFNPPFGTPYQYSITVDHQEDYQLDASAHDLNVSVGDGGISLNSQSSLTIVGPNTVRIFLTGDFNADNKSKIVFQDNGKLELILKGQTSTSLDQTVTFQNQSTTEGSTGAADFLIASATIGWRLNPDADKLTININQNAGLICEILAPNSKIDFSGSSQQRVFGVVVARTIETGGINTAGDYVTYDPSLDAIRKNDFLLNISSGSWKVIK